MIAIKQIDDSELHGFIKLYSEYNKCLVTNHNNYNSAKILVDKLILPGSLAIGLYKDTELIGFTLGCKHTEAIFNFTDMFILPKYRLYTKRLLVSSENYIRPKYNCWISSSHTKEGIKMFEHYGATAVEIKYYKEL